MSALATLVVAWHFGQLHALEKLGVFSLAIFPFVVLGLLQWWRGRQLAKESAQDDTAQDDTAQNDTAQDHSPAR